MKCSYKKYELIFNKPAGTSRGVYTTRTVWFLFLEEGNKTGIGECAPLPGLSKESPEQVEIALEQLQKNPQKYIDDPEILNQISSLKFAFETALLDVRNGGNQTLYSSEFTAGKQGIPINGLIWMGDIRKMKSLVDEKLKAGFSCIKLKVGSVAFNQEIDLLASIRKYHPKNKLTLRVDANGAFTPTDAHDKLKELAKLDIHSIEQPIRAGQWEEMAGLCQTTPVAIALDEELIGINERQAKEALLEAIQPQYLILKPSLHGGISGCEEWIELAQKRNIGWWITSYLESNIGLNAIAQWAFTKNVKIHQGLGTGLLFVNNIDSPLEIRGEKLWYNPAKTFKTEILV